MTGGRFIAVVGPSGVGKDSVMAGLASAVPGLGITRRVITRDADAGGEAFEPVSVPDFDALRDAGAFVLHWGAHGLYYGIPQVVTADLDAGRDMLVNLSRTVLSLAQRQFSGLVVLNLTASPDVLAERLAGRGRENAADIGQRLSRQVSAIPDGIDLRTVSNDGPLDQTIAAARAALYPDRV